MVSLPASATLGLPLTGAASISVPRASAWARICSAAAGEIVVESTIRPGVTSDRDSSAEHTCSTSAEPATIVNTMSRSASCAGSLTTVAPSFSRSAAFSRVRL
jgi:hypothetical protein